MPDESSKTERFEEAGSAAAASCVFRPPLEIEVLEIAASDAATRAGPAVPAGNDRGSLGPPVQIQVVDAMARLCPSGTTILWETVNGSCAGIHRLREESFRAVLFHHAGPRQDAREFLHAVRAAGVEAPIVVLLPEQEEARAEECYRLGGEPWNLECVPAGALARILLRAVERGEWERELRRLVGFQHRNLHSQREETQQQLEFQQRMLNSLYPSDGRPSGEAEAPYAGGHRESLALSLTESPFREWAEHYRHLLRAYIMMGTGNLTEEVSPWVRLTTAAGITVRQFLELHLQVVGELLARLGQRGHRHCRMRADQLLMEVLAHTAQQYEESMSGFCAVQNSDGARTLSGEQETGKRRE